MIKIKSEMKGFTLIELLVVISLIGILTSFMVMNYVKFRQSANDGVRKSDLRQIQAALEMYRADNGNYPNALPVCGAVFQDGAGNVTYMKATPCDPTTAGQQYQYAYNNLDGTYCLRACLQNLSDIESDLKKKGADNIACNGVANCNPGTTRSYTLQSP